MTPTYLYRKVKGQHTVGYFTRGKWWIRDVCWSAAFAEDRAVYLNGGTTEWSMK
jgi:hypothetical protein